ncbi:hypothetical protein EH284_23335 [Salmonella enterica]|nr:hypothetical protein [Salmonella enterica]
MMRSLTCSGLVMMACLLAGCGGGLLGKPSAAGSSSKAIVLREVPPEKGRVTGMVTHPIVQRGVSSSSSVSADSVVARCDRELKALKRLDGRRYAQRKAQFDRLMAGASLYAGIRTDVSGGTQETVDAMYRFRTGKLCAEISQDVLDALARQEGSGG